MSDIQYEKSGVSQIGLPKSRCSHILNDCPTYRLGHSANMGEPGELGGHRTPNFVSFAHNSTTPRSTT